jgi:hypothetical protein
MFSRKLSGSSRFSSLFSSQITGLLALAIAMCATTATASARDLEHLRGDVLTRGPATRVVAVGPIALHAYSEFAGGTLYSAPAVTGTDRDCAQISTRAALPVPADRITTFVVPQGQVACLATSTRGSFELLWHAVADSAAAPVMLASASK